MNPSRALLWLVVGVALTTAPSTPLQAQSTWTGQTSNSWDEATNWTPSGVPTDVALVFANADSYTVNLGETTRSVSGSGEGAITFNAAQDYTLTSGTLSLSGGIALNGAGDAIFNTAVTLGGGGRTFGGTGTGWIVFNDSLQRSIGALTISTDTRFSGSALNSLGTHGVVINNDAVLELAKTSQEAQASTLGTGEISISRGTLRINQSAAEFTNTVLIGSNPNTIEANMDASFGALLMNNGSRTLTLTGSATVTFNGPTGLITTATSARILTLNGAGHATFNGIVQNGSTSGGTMGLTKSGAGTVRLNHGSSTYTGATTVSSGILEVTRLANGSAASSIGQSSNAATNLTLSGGATLRYLGTGDTTDRNFQIGSGGAKFDASGSGAVIFTGDATQTNSGNRLIALIGSHTGANTLHTAFTDPGTGATRLEKDGAGRWILLGTHSYTGTTVIRDGTLQIDGTGSINASSGVTLEGGRLAYNSSVNYTGALAFEGGELGGTNWQGSLDNLTIGTDQVISPGNSPGEALTGSQTWAEGGAYLWEISDATGVAGENAGWDLLTGTGTLDITAGSGSPFHIRVASLSLDGQSGDALNFDPETDHEWRIASFANGIEGFNAGAFSIDTSRFTNSFSPESYFSVSLADNHRDLYLTYTYAIPEASTVWLLTGAGVLLGIFGRRRRSLI